MAHLIRKYNATNTSEPVSLGAGPLSVDAVSAAWYRNSLPTSKVYSSRAPLTGTDIISAKLLDSLRCIDSLAVRKPPKATLVDEYSKYSPNYPSSKPSEAYSSNTYKSTKAVSFSKPPNSDVYGGATNGYRLPHVKNEPAITSSFASRGNDYVAPYKTSEALGSPRGYASTYNTSYGTPTRDSLQTRAHEDNQSRDALKSRDERRLRNNMVAVKQRENSMYSLNPKDASVGTDEYYLRKMDEIVSRPTSSLFPSSPTQISDFMYVGGYRDAENWMYLKRLGITHVLNTAAMRRSTYNPYPPESGIVAYESFDADDSESYDVMQHFPRAKAFLDRCKWSGGKVLVHCAMGVNRSGTMCCAYLMADQKMALLDAVRRMKQKRYTSLSNRAFRRQLLRYAKLKGHL